MDDVLDLLDEQPGFVFTLDGQLATVDDYLEVRPEAEGRIRTLVAEGRLAIGPWQVLMDEFLVSGESMIRNLELGVRRAEELGGPMWVGYLPDMFGHVAQMPQILRRAGIEQAVLWRGVPAAIDGHRFRWEAPDGSEVETEYLVGGYANAAALLAVPERLHRRLELLHETLRPFYGDDDLLAMYGADHSTPLPTLVELAGQLNASQGGYRLEIETLAAYMSRAGSGGDLPHRQGELRSGARANLLMGVTSTRIPLKAACAHAERALERYAEPLSALHSEEWPERPLELAWRKVIENSAHDSICGCSVDEVADQVLVRFAEAGQIAAGLTERAARAAAARAPSRSTACLNPSPHRRASLVELDLAVPEDWEELALELPDGTAVAAQETGRTERLLATAELPGEELADRLWTVLGRELYGRLLVGRRFEEEAGRRTLTLELADEQDPAWLDTAELKHELEVATSAAPGETWLVRLVAPARRTVLARVPAPALGWTAVAAARRAATVEHAVTAGMGSLANGLVEVEVEEGGTLRIAGGGIEVTGAARLVEGGDAGDSYNYAPPADDIVVASPGAVDVQVLEEGPLRGRLRIVRDYRWPLGLTGEDQERTAETAPVSVETHVELRAGEPFVRLRFAFENPCSDHRLRTHFPLPTAAQRSSAEGQFAVVERGLEAEGGYGEVPLPHFPARGFVCAGGLAVLLPHVLEYELVEGKELALTLLRSTGLISRNRHPYRAEPAGPEVAIPGAQLRGGEIVVELALLPQRGEWHEAGVLAAAEAYAHEFVTAPGTGSPEAAREETGLELRGDGVILTALRRRGDWLEARLVCEHPHPVAAVLAGGIREAREADLLGRPGAALASADGELRVDLAPWEIRTVQLRR